MVLFMYGFIFLAAIQSASGTCAARYQIITDHSACLSKSANAQSSGVSASEKTEIVNLHNQYRNNVSPTSRNMLKMAWDDDVAIVAQAYADNCVYEHDDNYARLIPGRYDAGQNLAITSGSHSWSAMIELWHSESNHFTFGSGSTTSEDVGHYTQMVWAKSHKIGCGYAYCTNLMASGAGFYVCNYSPAGNLAGSQNSPYETGSSCGDCPNSCSGNLCDCSSSDCYNGGTFDVDTCACACKGNAAYYVGSSCALNCTGIGTPFCGFNSGQCSSYSNVPFDCPVTCGFCPAGDSTSYLHGQTTTPSSASAKRTSHWTSLGASMTVAGILVSFT